MNRLSSKCLIAFSLLFLWILLTSIPAFAASGSCGTWLTWSLDTEGTLTISGKGKMNDFSVSGCGPWGNDVRKVVIQSGVTSIGQQAFYNCSGLTSVTIPDSVTSIGSNAFYGCSSLTNVSIGNGVTHIYYGAFGGCNNIKEVHISSLESWLKITFDSDASNPLHVGNASLYLNNQLLTEAIIPGGITRIGNSAFSGCSGLTSVSIPDSVTSIGYDAFSGCSSLTSVNIPDGVTSIGYDAFSGCSGLTSVNIPDGVTSIGGRAFYGCPNITEVTVPGCMIERNSYNGDSGLEDYFSAYATISKVTIADGVTSIGDSAFYNCSGLTSVTIPDSVTSIGSYAFKGCSGLTSVTIPDSVTSIGSNAFYGCTALTDITIPSGVTGIGCAAFADCSGLTRVTIPDSVTSIGSEAFYGCSGLTSVTIPDSVTSIGNSAFSGCSGLTSVTIPDSVTSIDCYTFYNCSGLTSVTIPDSVTSIGSNVFSNCTSIMEVTVPGCMIAGNTSRGSSGTLMYYFPSYAKISKVSLADGCTKIGENAFYGCSGLTSVTIPDSVTSIGSNTFYNCSGLTSVTIPDNVTSIGSNAFYNCSGLTNVTIPDSVTSIDSYAFKGCSGLTSVTIPDSVTSIGFCAFEGCSKLTGVTIPTGVTSIDSSTFSGCSGLTSVNIPDGVTSIGYEAFYNCSGLTSVTIPDSVTSIGSNVFSNCTSIMEVTVPGWMIAGNTSSGLSYYFPSYAKISKVSIADGYTKIGENAFYGCSGLTNVTIPDSVTSIGSYAFSGCSGLTSVSIPDSVTSIGYEAFSGCTNLAEVHIESLENWVNMYFADYDANPLYCSTMCVLYVNNQAVTEIIIPEGVTRIRNYTFAGCNMTSIILPDSVTDIGDYAFFCCKNLANVQFSAGVKTLGPGAFRGCSSLKTITLPDNITSISAKTTSYITGSIPADTVIFATPGSATAVTLSKNDYTFRMFSAPDFILKQPSEDSLILLSYCGTDTQVIIPEGVTQLGVEAFDENDNIQSITIPSTMTDISSDRTSPFSGLKMLSEIIISDGVSHIPSSCFSSCFALKHIVIPESVTVIGSGAFSNCSSLTEITLPVNISVVDGTNENWPSASFSSAVTLYTEIGSVTAVTLSKAGYHYSIPSAPGYKLRSLTADEVVLSSYQGTDRELVLPEGITSIRNNAFADNNNISSIVVPSSVTSIGEKAFYCCSGLNTVYINGDISIAKNAFAGCRNLHDITILGSSEIGSEAFSNCSALDNIDLRQNVVKWGALSFAYCDSLTSIVIPEGTTYIGSDAFRGCSSLTSITIPDSVTYIGSDAFRGCSSLTSVTIPGSVTSIDFSAFYGCSNLDGVIILGRGSISISSESIPKTSTIYCYEFSEVDFWATEEGYRVVYLDAQDPEKPVNIEMPEEGTLWAGETWTILARLLPTGDSSKLQWSSSNPAVATVENGVIKAMAPGRTVITATYENLMAEMTVTVRRKVESFDLSAMEMWIVSKNKSQLTVQNILPQDANPSFTWESSNTTSLTVDKNGKISALVPGEAAITVTSDCGASRTCVVHVCHPVTAVVFEKEAVELAFGESIPLTALATTQGQTLQNKLVAFSSSNPAVATVDDQGMVTAVGYGTADIIATAVDYTGQEQSAIAAIADDAIQAVCRITVPGAPQIPGDANDDGIADILDALLVLKYDAGWDVAINEANSDVNADGYADILDALMILKYDAGWDIVLLPSNQAPMMFMRMRPPCPHTSGTEIRNAVDSTYEQEGYSGDLCCLACGEILEAGVILPKLVRLPQTGDSSYPVLWFALTSLSCIALVILLRNIRGKRI